MSKKSRRRTKKILAMLALAGGAAMAGKRKRNAAIDTGIASAEADKGSDMLADSADSAVTGTEYPGANKVVAPVSTGNIGNTITRTSGIKKSPSGQLIGAGGLQGGKSRGELAQIMQAKANAPRGIIRPGNYTPITHGAAFGHRGVGFKKGGSVKKAKVTGIAKRGFGRALMKGKK